MKNIQLEGENPPCVPHKFSDEDYSAKWRQIYGQVPEVILIKLNWSNTKNFISVGGNWTTIRPFGSMFAIQILRLRHVHCENSKATIWNFCVCDISLWFCTYQTAHLNLTFEEFIYHTVLDQLLVQKNKLRWTLKQCIKSCNLEWKFR
jgi:hypothetical protein